MKPRILSGEACLRAHDGPDFMNGSTACRVPHQGRFSTARLPGRKEDSEPR